MKDEFVIDSHTKLLIAKKSADLKIQSMIFDMDIDWETLELMPKAKDTTPIWIKRWREKQDNSDYMPDGSDDQEWGED